MNSVTVVPCGRKVILTGLCRAAAVLLLALTALSASPEAALAQANEGDVRLNSRGRLFLYERGAWGTVCDDGLDGRDRMPGERVAQVVCRQLGRTGGTFLPHTELPTFFGSEGVRFYNVNCMGTESRLADCTYTYSTNVPCDHSEDVGVRCNAELLPPPPGSPTGLPTITGTARVGQTLTVDTSGISDPDGPEVLEFAYQWLARGVAIASDGYGPVRWRLAATGQPTITGRYRVDDTLTARRTSAAVNERFSTGDPDAYELWKLPVVGWTMWT